MLNNKKGDHFFDLLFYLHQGILYRKPEMHDISILY